MVPPNTPVPPTRALAAMLGVSRNTVALAVQSLVDHGYVISRARSGLYVNADILESHARAVAPASTRPAADLHWSRRFRYVPSTQRNITKPGNWQEFQYPFIYGQFDNSLLPFADWRECDAAWAGVPAQVGRRRRRAKGKSLTATVVRTMAPPSGNGSRSLDVGAEEDSSLGPSVPAVHET